MSHAADQARAASRRRGDPRRCDWLILTLTALFCSTACGTPRTVVDAGAGAGDDAAMRDVPAAPVPPAGWPWEVGRRAGLPRGVGQVDGLRRVGACGPRRDRSGRRDRLAWLRDLGARWRRHGRTARTRRGRARDCAHAGPTRRAGRRPGARGRRDLHLLARQGGRHPVKPPTPGDAQGRSIAAGSPRGASASTARATRSMVAGSRPIRSCATRRASAGCSASCRPGRSGPVTSWCSRAATSRAGASRSATSAWSSRPGRRSGVPRRTATGRAVAADGSASAMVGRGGGRGGATGGVGLVALLQEPAPPWLTQRGDPARHDVREVGDDSRSRGRRRSTRSAARTRRAPRARGRSGSGRA